MTATKIEWTDSTWNPITGCTKISDGCKNCYAARMAKRLQYMGSERYKNGFNLTIHEDLFEAPLSWKKPSIIFVNSMSDLFHEDIPEETILRLFDVMKRASQHTFQILTKRAERLADMASRIRWPRNVWMGVSIESEKYIQRIELLRTIPSEIKFISFEPLLSQIDEKHSLKGIDWVIVGGESGPLARPMAPEWVHGIQRMADRDEIKFFFKQWGGVNKKKAGRLLDGREWNSMPDLEPVNIFV